MFDRTCVINLDRRPARWEAFCDRLPHPWAWPTPERISATDGLAINVPTHWRSGPGAYGCRASHLRLWQQAAEEDHSLLVFEDDCVFCDRFIDRAEAFLRHVPDDWQMIYFGGAHRMPPSDAAPGVLRVGGCTKTHAYAIRGKALVDLRNNVEKAEIHIDVCMNQLHYALPVYAPVEWLCGQAAAVSDVMSGSQGEPERWFDGRDPR